jgi:hypothetical protein
LSDRTWAELVLAPFAPPASGMADATSALALLARSDVIALTVAADGAGQESLYGGIVRDAGHRQWQGGYRPWTDGQGFWLVPDFMGDPVYRLSAQRMAEAPPHWCDEEALAQGLRLANSVLLGATGINEVHGQ